MSHQIKNIVNRCWWVNMQNPLYVEYHDNEWGIPEHSDKKLFEMLMLECFQAGLSWECVLNKRDGFRQAFDNFDIVKISQYDDAKCEQLLSAPIIRNRLKIKACVTNSRVFMQIQKEYGSFDAYIWGFTNGKTILESCDIRSTSPLSDEISKSATPATSGGLILTPSGVIVLGYPLKEVSQTARFYSFAALLSRLSSSICACIYSLITSSVIVPIVAT